MSIKVSKTRYIYWHTWSTATLTIFVTVFYLCCSQEHFCFSLYFREHCQNNWLHTLQFFLPVLLNSPAELKSWVTDSSLNEVMATKFTFFSTKLAPQEQLVELSMLSWWLYTIHVPNDNSLITMNVILIVYTENWVLEGYLL